MGMALISSADNPGEPSSTSDSLPSVPPEPGSYADWLQTVSGVTPASQSIHFVDDAREPAPPTQPEYAGPRVRRPLPLIPGYEILQEMGRGGMGVVYKARHLGLNRLVALKMILVGDLASPEALARFRSEAQLLAQLQHPHIVQVYDVGTIEDKSGIPRPYMALELVEGGSLSRQLRYHPQPPREAATLLETLARAIQAAHEKGIIHRDLKPGNVLLANKEPQRPVREREKETPSSMSLHTPMPLSAFQPKITDFGLAKRLEGDSSQTRTGEIVGTPNYMAPEQAAGRNPELGPAVDIYALGAILYEALTGRPPYQGVSPTDTVLQVLGRDPLPPSYLQHELPPDLETICLKCLRREPHQRYASAAAVAEDLRRFLAGEPILARPVGRLERAWRWVKRNPVLGALSAAVVLLLLSGTAVSGYFALLASERAELAERNADLAWRQQVRAQQKTLEAEKSAARAQEEGAAAHLASEFLAGLFQDSDPIAVGGRVFGALPRHSDTLLAREVVDRGRQQLGTKLKDQPKLRALLLDLIGNVYLGLGDVTEAEKLVNEGLALRRAHLPPDHPDLAASLQSLGFIRFLRHQTADAAALFRAALAIREQHFGPDHPATAETMIYLAMPLVRDAAYGEGEALLYRAMAIRRQQPGDQRRDLAAPLVILCYSLLKRGALAEAVVPLAELARIGGEVEIGGIGVILKKGAQAKLMEKLNARQAVTLWREAIAEATASLGPDHFVLTFLRSELIEQLVILHDGPALEKELRIALPLLQRFYRTNSHLVGNALRNLAYSLHLQGKHDAAVPIVMEAIDVLRKLPDGDGRWRLAQAWYLRGWLALAQGDLTTAEAAWREEVTMRTYLYHYHQHNTDPLRLTYPLLEEVVYFQDKPAAARWAVLLDGSVWWQVPADLPPLPALVGTLALSETWDACGLPAAAATLQASTLPAWNRWRKVRSESECLRYARPRLLAALARSRARAGATREAWQLLRQAIQLTETLPAQLGPRQALYYPVQLMEQACLNGFLVRVLDEQAASLPPEARPARQRLAARAVGLLHQALAAGYANEPRLHTDPDLANLQVHPEFPRLPGAREMFWR